MKTEILIVTYSRDFPYLRYCLKSIKKFAKGFFQVTIVIPNKDLEPLVAHKFDCPDNTVIRAGEEWPGKGFVWHMAQILRADDWCPTADFIAHIDPDCIFTEPVTPEDYIQEGKPILRFEYFSSIGQRHPGCAAWQEPTQRCLPFLVTMETMRCHPGVYHRGLYAEARNQIEKKTGQPCDDYIRSCRNESPQGFCEFVTLGNVALHCFPDKYLGVEQKGDCLFPDNKLQQFWSHAPIESRYPVWVKGEFKEVVPIEIIKSLGLL